MCKSGGNPMSLKYHLFFLIAISLVSLGTANAENARVEVGALTCNINAGTNFIIGSTKTLNCRFKNVSGEIVAKYKGDIKKFGIDLGQAKNTVVTWAVVAPTSSYKNSFLNGTYIGVAADASVGLGAGAKVLVGGAENTITLQPLSLQSQTGLNLAVSVAEMKLYSY